MAMSEQFTPPAFNSVPTPNERRHNSAPDRIVLCSGGMDSVAMAHYLIEEVWDRDDGWGAWHKRPIVVYLETTIGLSSQRLYTQLLGREYGWQVVCWQTHQDFAEYSEDAGFHGNDAHDGIFNVLKGRQIGKAATLSGNPHVYFGSRVDEKGDHVERVQWRDDIGAYAHNPIYDWSDEDVVAYLRDREVPFNPNWEAAHFTDCGCGATAAREELLELEAERYERFAAKLRELETRVETGDKRETWAWGSFDPDDQRVLDAQADNKQATLGELVCGPNCSGRAKVPGDDLPLADGGASGGDSQ
jgi:3'-phosphoadenosine 5'-phosphosulfate sulfotransferase (PAPS reductase)/FAD synthetase